MNKISEELKALYIILDTKKEKLDSFRPLSSEQSKNLKKVYFSSKALVFV